MMLMHGASKYVTRNGKRIAVIEYNLGPPRKVSKARDGAFVMIPLRDATLAARAMKNPALLVYVELMYCAWRAKGGCFALSNKWLEMRGASRWTKNRVLRDLEAAGLIEVDQRGRRAPRIRYRRA
jgi:hypothetical protein